MNVFATTCVFGLAGATAAVASWTLVITAKPFAERFLTLLDAGDTGQAYEMLNPEVRARLGMNRLSRLGAVRGFKGVVKRTFLRVNPVRPTAPNKVGHSNVIVCFVENPSVNFKTVSYTAVTVSSVGPSGKLQIDNFQTTSEPATACR